jgi:hypothetical protein
MVSEAKELFYAYPYFSIKNPFLDLSLKIICAQLVPGFYLTWLLREFPTKTSSDNHNLSQDLILV